MQSTPDLSRIVSLIMQNPDLIEQISALASKETPEPAAQIESASEESAPVSLPTNTEAARYSDPSHSQRRELLCALKPYLSENRRSAIDSMMSISDILGMMRKR